MKTSKIKSYSPFFLLFCFLLTNCERDLFSPLEKLQASDDPNFECGCDMVDERDGRVYKTVKIGDQCWMAQNLNYGQFIENSVYIDSPKMVNRRINNGIPEKLCPEDDSSKCEDYGGFYSWEELMDYPSPSNLSSNPGEGCTPNLNFPKYEVGICPRGWKIPSDFDYQKMQAFLDPEAVECNAKGNIVKYKLLHQDLCNNESNCDHSGFSAKFVGVITFSFSNPIQNWQHFGVSVSYWASTPTGYKEDSECTDLSENCRAFIRKLHVDSTGIIRNTQALYTKQNVGELGVVEKDRHTVALPCRCVSI